MDGREQRMLCHGWGVRKTQDGGFREGALVQGAVIEISKNEWKELWLCREDLRDKANLDTIHLVPVYFRGDVTTFRGYTLSARIDRQSWEKIEKYMERVDSDINEELYEGDRFIGWVVKGGEEERVENILQVKRQYRIRFRQEGTPGSDLCT